MIEVKPGTIPDLLAIEYEPILFVGDNREEFASNGAAAEALLRDWSFCLYEDGKPIAAVGLIPKWEAVAYAWAILSNRSLERYPVALMRMTLGAMRVAEEERGIRRIEAHALLSHRPALRWLRHLGFSREGKAHGYGPGALGTFVLFGRVRQG